MTGAIVLVVEILGARMLTPWFGSSHFVWTAQITITLLALAAGYYLGGWAGDRWGRLEALYGGLVLAAVYLGLTVMFRDRLAAGCLRFSLAWGSMLASFLLFFVPLTLLAATGPFLVRSLARKVEGLGRIVGRLSALGTVGSVVGVVVTSHVVIPLVRDSVAMLWTAGVLVALAGVYMAGWGGRGGGRGSVVAGAVVVAWISVVAMRAEAGNRFRNHVELARDNSHFGMLQVIESRDGASRYFLNDWLLQNTYDARSGRSLSMFTYALHELSRGYTPDLKSALCLGMGIGIVPRELAREGVDVDVVEINPAVVPLAERWFGFDRGLVRLVIDDARHFVRVTENRYDTVQLDAFLGDSSPGHLMSREAFEEIRSVLRPGGTLVINAFADFSEGRDFFATALHRTLSEVFASVAVHVSPSGNAFFVASDRVPMTFQAPSAERWVGVPARAKSDLEGTLREARPMPEGKGMVLTDDYNPVEYYDAANRERTRRTLVRASDWW
jgi:spermidine synthase